MSEPLTDGELEKNDGVLRFLRENFQNDAAVQYLCNAFERERQRAEKAEAELTLARAVVEAARDRSTEFARRRFEEAIAAYDAGVKP